MKKNEFKCMDWIRAVREKHARELKNKSAEERIAFYQKSAKALHTKLQR